MLVRVTVSLLDFVCNLYTSYMHQGHIISAIAATYVQHK